MYPNSIVKKVGKLPGKTVAVFAGVHGNEKVGIVTLDKIGKELEVESGTVYLVYANPLAIEKNVRVVDKNLNRLFSRDNQGETYEDLRAVELMNVLDECEALLDIHSYNSESGEQFAISEKNGYDILSKMNFPIVVSGFSSLCAGTDSYMYKNGKVGICIECGTTNQYEKFLNLAENSIYQFLQYYGCVNKKVDDSNVLQKHFTVKEQLHKKTEGFRFTGDYKDFETLPTDKPFAIDGSISYTAKEGEVIIFPRPDVPVGGEVCCTAQYSN